MSTPIGRLDVAVFDCPDPNVLGAFYQQIVGGALVGHDHDWVELHTPDGKVAFQKIENYHAPIWPEGGIPQQAHLDVDVADLDAAEAAVIEVGAIKAETQPAPDHFRVFLDPAGHPFCIVKA